MKLRMFVLIVGAILGGTAATRATVLLFENTSGARGGLEGNNATGYSSNVMTNYGDRVNSILTADPDPGYAGTMVYTNAIGNGWTPNVVTAFSHQGGTSAGIPTVSGHIMYDDAFLGNYAGDESDYLAFRDGFKFWITFTPDVGYGVKMNSFDIDDYNFNYAVSPNVSWALRQDTTNGTILASGTQLALLQGETRPVNTGPTAYNGTMILELSFTGTSDNGVIHLDNLNFDQVAPIPEPSAILLLAVGGLLVWQKRNLVNTHCSGKGKRERGKAMKLRMFVLTVTAILSWTAASQAALVLRYTFDEATSGTTPALNVGGSAGPTANGVFIGNTTRTTSTPNNFSTAALSISQTAAADYVGPALDNNALDALPAMTITMWLNVQGAGIPGSGGFIPLAGDFGAGNLGWIFYYNQVAGLQQFGLEVDATASVASTNINVAGAWTFVAAAWDGTDVRFYAGSTNSAVSVLSTNALSTAMTGNSATMNLGTYANSTIGPTAFIDDFRIYNTALDLSELSAIQLENLQLLVPEPSTVLLLLAGAGLIWRQRKLGSMPGSRAE